MSGRRSGGSAPGIQRLTSSDSSLTLTPSSGRGSVVDLKAAGGASGNSRSTSGFAPFSTASAASVMAGLAVAFTPKASSKLLVVVNFTLSSNTNGDGGSANLRAGIGAAPGAGSAAVGTQWGGNAYVPNVTSNQRIGAGLNAVITGLTIGQAIWLDLALQQIGGGTVTLQDVMISMVEAS